jgi:hypothetical protein
MLASGLAAIRENMGMTFRRFRWRRRVTEASTTLPPLDHTVRLAANAAVAMSEVARAEYSDAVLAEVQETDRRLGAGVFSDPARFAHQVANAYLLCAGDFVCGMQYVTTPRANLVFSSAALARSACEFANRAWWLADPDISVEQRIARGIAVMKNTVDEEAAVLEPTTLADLQDLVRRLDEWRQLLSFTETARLPRPTALFSLASPDSGDHDYKRLCNATHGSFLTVLMGHQAAITGAVEREVDAWWRVLTACRYGLQAAVRLTNLQGNEPPQSLQNASMLGQQYMNRCRQWEDAQRT